MASLIEVKCLQCGKSLKVNAQFAGKKGKCPVCAKIISIPDPKEKLDLLTIEEGVRDDQRKIVAATLAAGPGGRGPEKKRGFFARLFGRGKKKKR